MASINSINDYYINFNIETSSVRQLKIRMFKLIEFIFKFGIAQKVFFDFDPEREDDIDQITFNDFTFTLMANMEDRIARHQQIETPNPTQFSDQSHTSISETVKLPTIKIPTFNGDLEN
jgi:hypothetical protein